MAEARKCESCGERIWAGDRVIQILTAGWYEDPPQDHGKLAHFECVNFKG